MSSVSSAMRLRESGGTNSSVRMLCRRSASLTSSTRTSSAIASSSLRRFSACLASRETSSSRFSLVRPSTSAPISWPNSWSISARVASVSSIVSCSSAATMVASSSLRSVRIAATSSGCEKIGIAGGPGLRAVRLHGVDIGAVEQVFVGVRVVGRTRSTRSYCRIIRVRSDLAGFGGAAAGMAAELAAACIWGGLWRRTAMESVPSPSLARMRPSSTADRIGADHISSGAFAVARS